MMQTVQHPSFENVTQTVSDPTPWVEQGWTLLEAIDEAPGQPEPEPRRASK